MAATDIIMMAVVLFAFGTALFITHYFVGTTVDSLIAEPLINESNVTVRALEATKTVSNRLDYVFFGLFIGLILAFLISSWLIGGHPIFMFIYFILGVISVILSALAANVWEVISATAPISSSLSEFAMTNHILLYGPYYMAAILFIGVVVMFGKSYYGGYQ